MTEDVCSNFHGGATTSVRANEDAGPRKKKLADRIESEIRGSGTNGLTCDEIENLLSIRHQTASARCSELLRDGRVLKGPVERKTRSGSDATVLFAPEFAPSGSMGGRRCRMPSRAVIHSATNEIRRLCGSSPWSCDLIEVVLWLSSMSDHVND